MNALDQIAPVIVFIIATIVTGSGRLIAIGMGVIDVPDEVDMGSDRPPSWDVTVHSLYVAISNPQVATFKVDDQFAACVVHDSLVCDLAALMDEISVFDLKTLLYAASIAYLAMFQSPTTLSVDFIIWVVDNAQRLDHLLKQAPGIQWAPIQILIPRTVYCIKPFPDASVHNIPAQHDCAGDDSHPDAYDEELDCNVDDDDDDEYYEDEDDGDDGEFGDKIRRRFGRRVWGLQFSRLKTTALWILIALGSATVIVSTAWSRYQHSSGRHQDTSALITDV